jgi:PAS domain S-box-containing protein
MNEAHMSPTGPHPELIKEAEQLAARHPQEVIALWGLDRICYYVSPSIRKQQGYEPSDMIGHHYMDFLVPGDLAHVELARSDADLNDDAKVTTTVRLKSGDTMRVYSHSMKREHPETREVFMLTRIVPAIDRPAPDID